MKKVLNFKPSYQALAELPLEEVEETLNFMVECEREDFAASLLVARSMWHQHRQLVESVEFPEPFRSALKKSGEAYDRDVNTAEWARAADSNLRELLRPRAIESVKRRLAHEAARRGEIPA